SVSGLRLFFSHVYSFFSLFLIYALLIFDKFLVLIIIQNTSCCDVSLDIIGFAELALHYAFVGGRMDELVIPEIDANMRDGFAIRIEKDKITRAQLILGYRSPFFGLGGRCA